MPCCSHMNAKQQLHSDLASTTCVLLSVIGKFSPESCVCVCVFESGVHVVVNRCCQTNVLSVFYSGEVWRPRSCWVCGSTGPEGECIRVQPSLHLPFLLCSFFPALVSFYLSCQIFTEIYIIPGVAGVRFPSECQSETTVVKKKKDFRVKNNFTT